MITGFIPIEELAKAEEYIRQAELELYDFAWHGEKSINIKSLKTYSDTQFLYTSKDHAHNHGFFHIMYVDRVGWEINNDSQFWKAIYTAAFFKILAGDQCPTFSFIYAETPSACPDAAKQAIAQRAFIQPFLTFTLPMSPLITLRSTTEEGLRFDVVDNRQAKRPGLFNRTTPLTTYGGQT